MVTDSPLLLNDPNQVASTTLDYISRVHNFTITNKHYVQEIDAQLEGVEDAPLYRMSQFFQDQRLDMEHLSPFK